MTTITNQQAVRIAEGILSSGGATWNDKGLISRMSGYQVGILGEGWVADAPADDLSHEDKLVYLWGLIVNYTDAHGHILEDGHDLGAWVSDEKVYLDASRHVAELDRAMLLGELGEQQEIYDWGTERCLPVVPVEHNWTVVEA